MLEAARSIGIPTFENQNGRMMEGAGGSSIADLRIATESGNPFFVLMPSLLWTGQI
jgi:hypothetical protein